MRKDTVVIIDARREGDALWIRVEGELDVSTEPELIQVGEGVENQNYSKVVLDIRQVAFMDSSGLRAALWLRDHVEGEGMRFSLAVSDGPVKRLLQVAGVASWFTYE